jgi:molybdopterin-guanine dinucleotide biosynthesis protein B
MKTIAFVGSSESGKTRLIARLLPELKGRGLAVGVVKHCGHGFDLGAEDKDSSKFLDAGADAVALAGAGRTAVLRRTADGAGLEDLIRRELGAADIVLVEGGKSEPALKKIEVMRSGVSGEVATAPRELVAIVSDRPRDAGVPVFSPDQVKELAEWLAAAIVTNRTSRPGNGGEP